MLRRGRIEGWSPWVDPVVVAAVGVLAFLPGLFGDFLNWDDDAVFLEQVSWRGVGLGNLSWMVTSFHMGHYRPLTWMSHGIDHVLWGLHPAGYHLTSVLLHAAAAVAVLFLARQLLRLALDPPASEAALRLGSAGAALLFAVHPLRVEPVTWLSTRADVLSGLLAVLTVIAYLRACHHSADGPSSRVWFWVGVGLFALALLSKAMVMTLPLVLLLLDVYPLRRLGPGAGGWFGRAPRRVWGEKLPFLALAAGAAAVALSARLQFGSVLDLADFSVRERATAVVYGLALYLGKSVVPLGLSPLYDYRSILEQGLQPVLLGGIAAVGATALAVLLGRRWSGFAAAWAVQVAMVLPVSGLVQNGPQIAADRYTYLATLGWAVLAGAAIARGMDAWQRGRARAALAGGVLVATAVLLVGLVALTARQTLVWQDSVTLWRHAVHLDPGSPIAQLNLGTALWPSDADQALVHFQRAVELAPGLAQAHQGLGFVMSLQGRDDEALAHVEQAVRSQPEAAHSWLFLGEALRVNGRLAEATAAFRKAARLDPGAPQPRFRLAATLAALGERDQALRELAQGAALARAAGQPEAEGHRASALVYERFDPARAAEAWRRYLGAVGPASRLRGPEQAKVLAALAALDRLDGSRAGPAPSGGVAGGASPR